MGISRFLDQEASFPSLRARCSYCPSQMKQFHVLDATTLSLCPRILEAPVSLHSAWLLLNTNHHTASLRCLPILVVLKSLLHWTPTLLHYPLISVCAAAVPHPVA